MEANMMNFLKTSLIVNMCIFAIVVLAHDTSNDDVQVIANATQGQVKGKIMESMDGKQFIGFLGIPYGKVEKRFTDGKPAGPWEGVLNATEDAPPCKQYDTFFRKKILGEEDCLTLNIYTPKLPTGQNSSELLPVLVFIYGGGFVVGEATSTGYGPERLLDYPIVLAIMNYRVASFGFLSTHDDAAIGNFGLTDQALALKWIQDNIKDFGGDPNRVTISGESAGAGSVAFHLISNVSKGLFHGAIMQSGAALCPWSIQEKPLNITKSLATKLNCTTENTPEMVECLREVDADALLMAENETSLLPDSFINSFGPVIQNPGNGERFLTESPLQLLKDGRFNKVPVISGVTAYEAAYSIKALDLVNETLPVPKDLQDDTSFNKIIDALVNVHENKKIDPAKIKQTYFKDVDFKNKDETVLQEVNMLSDVLFRSCNDATVRLLSTGGIPVYMYVFDYAVENEYTTNYSGKPDAIHGMDLYFLYKLGFVNMTESEEAEIFGKKVLDLWTNFVIHGDPTPSGPLDWNPTPPGSIKYLNITTDMAMVDGYFTDEMKFWDGQLYRV